MSDHRRSLAAAGIYASALLGFLGPWTAARQLSVRDFGSLALVLAAAGFFQTLLDLTVEEAVVKYGFRYTTTFNWGRLRWLFRKSIQFKVAGAAMAGAALVVMAFLSGPSLKLPLLIAAALPLAQAPEGLAAATFLLLGRYDVRGGFLTLSMMLRFAAFGLGSQFGVWQAVLLLVVAQVLATCAISVAAWLAFRRFPAGESTPLGEDRRGILNFVGQSSLASGVVSLGGTLAPLLLGLVSGRVQVGFYRVAQAPQAALAVLSAPIRLILLSDQTREWEQGSIDAVFAGLRRFTIRAASLVGLLVPPLLWFAGDLIRIVYGERYVPATNATRFIIVAAALHFVVGWAKTLPVSAGRPSLRLITHGLETVVLLPLVVALGGLWGATGAAGAVAISSGVFVVLWVVLVTRMKAANLVPSAGRL